MPTINYAESYARELANAYGYTLHFGALWSTDNSSKYKPVDAKTIKIPKLSVGGRVDGDRDTIGAFSRNWSNEWETKELTNHRTWQSLIHPEDIKQTNSVAAIANITKVMNETQKFPEMDAYLVSRLYTLKNDIESIDTVSPTTITINSVLPLFDGMMDKMDEANVPSSGRILYVDTYTKTLMDNAREVYRTNGDASLRRTVSRIEEVNVVSVPTKLMKTEYDFTNGWKPAVDALQIKMLLVHPSCVLPVANYSFAQLESPSAMSQGKYVYYEESFEDVFILNDRHDGIQMVVCDETAGGSTIETLTVTSEAGETSGSSVISVSREAASDNKFVYRLANSYASFAYDEVLPASAWTELPEDGVVDCGSYTRITIAEVDADNKAKARGIVQLVKKE